MRTAAFEPSKAQIVHEEQAKNENEQKIEALKRYDNVLKNIGEELMVSGKAIYKENDFWKNLYITKMQLQFLFVVF